MSEPTPDTDSIGEAEIEVGFDDADRVRAPAPSSELIGSLRRELDSVAEERDRALNRAEVAEEVAADALWAHTVVEAARPNAGECVNFSPESPYNCYEVDPQPYLTMPCLACALVIYDGAVNPLAPNPQKDPDA